jgi:hypothetical protein
MAEHEVKWKFLKISLDSSIINCENFGDYLISTQIEESLKKTSNDEFG